MHHAGEICKLFTQTIAELEAACAQMREALEDERSEIIRGGRHHVEERRMSIIDNALSSGCGKELLERLNKLEDRLKTAASMLRYAVYERTPLGDKWIDHFDIERQKAITEFLASVEGGGQPDKKRLNVRTAEQLLNDLSFGTHKPSLSDIAAIQSDAREGVIGKEELRAIIWLLEKNSSQHGESASWEYVTGKQPSGTNRAAWMIEENTAAIKHLETLLASVEET